MRTLERAGARIGYEVAGEGPAVVLGHSLLCDGRMWDAVAPVLARRYRVINIDARGHRASTWPGSPGSPGSPGPFTLDDLAEDWRAILDAERVDRAALCGLSMGGMTAMRLALAAPERVAALALLDTSADAEAAVKRLQYRLLAEIFKAFGNLAGPLEAPLRRIMFGVSTRADKPGVVARELGRMREQDARQIYHATRAVFDRPSIFGRLGAIRCPTLVMVGEEDVATPPDRARRIAGAIPGARLEVIPRAGHLTTVEQPEAVTAILLAFLERAFSG